MRSSVTILHVVVGALAVLAPHASAEVRLTIKEVTTIRPTHDGRYFGRASLQVNEFIPCGSVPGLHGGDGDEGSGPKL
jgi:hypothetical protein